MKTLMLSTALIAVTGLAAGLGYAETAAVTGGATVDAGAATDPAKTDLSVAAAGDAAAGADAGVQTDAAVTAPEATMPTHQPVVREGFEAADMAGLTSDVLIGATAYDSNDVKVGEVSELVIGADKKMTDLVVDVGGFLGIGEKPVALKIADLDILRASAGGEVRVYISMTKEQLEALPAYAE